jgi:ApaG protein
METGTSEAVTEGIRVAVRSAYVEERSYPAMNRHFFVYHITVENRATQPVKLTSRHWIITNGHGDVEEVQGPGVVGVQPTIRPGEGFQYTSACPLDTPVGSMRGTYRMVREDGTEFDAQIESFTLIAPNSLN